MDETKKKAESIVQALRCTNTEGGGCRGPECLYCITGSEDEIGELMRELKVSRDKARELASGCDFERIGLDAAELIEQTICNKGE